MPDQVITADINGREYHITADIPAGASNEDIMAAVNAYAESNPRMFEAPATAAPSTPQAPRSALKEAAQSVERGGMEALRGLIPTNPLDYTATNNPIANIGQELARSGQETRNVFHSLAGGHPLDALNNVLKAIPGLGAQVQPIEEKLQQGKYGEAFGQGATNVILGGLGGNLGKSRVAGAISAAPEMVSRLPIAEHLGPITAGAKAAATTRLYSLPLGLGKAIKAGVDAYDKEKALKTTLTGTDAPAAEAELMRLQNAKEGGKAALEAADRLSREGRKAGAKAPTLAEVSEAAAKERKALEIQAEKNRIQEMAVRLLAKPQAEFPTLPVGNRGLGRLGPNPSVGPAGPRPTGIPEGQGAVLPAAPEAPAGISSKRLLELMGISERGGLKRPRKP